MKTEGPVQRMRQPQHVAELEELHEEHAVPSQIWRTFYVDMFAVGTAVTPISADHRIPTPAMVLALDS